MPVDAVSTVTPLAAINEAGAGAPARISTCSSATWAAASAKPALCAAHRRLYLVARRVIDPSIPVVYIATVGLFTWVAGPNGLFTGDGLYHILAGGLMLAPSTWQRTTPTSPMTIKGRIIFALGCGVLTSVIRLWAAIPRVCPIPYC